MTPVRPREALTNRLLPLLPLVGCGAALWSPLLPVRDPWFQWVALCFIGVSAVATAFGWCHRLRAHLVWASACVVLSFWLLQYHLQAEATERDGLQFDFRHVRRMQILDEELGDRRGAKERARQIVGSNAFVQTRLSGSEVVAIAVATATRDGDDLKDYGDPHLGLSFREGRLVWYVSFYRLPGAPGMFFTVEIDDATKQAVVHPGM